MAMNLPVLFLVLFLGHAHSEVFTALVDLEELLHTESVFINTLNHYILAQEQRISLLKKYSLAYQKHHEEAAEDIQTYVANPLNAYLLVKRLTADWKQVESLMSYNVGEDFVANLSRYRGYLKFPSEEDLNGAAVALTRLQDTYHLDTSSLARGEINGVKYSTELSAADCFELGRQSYNIGDFYHSKLWMTEADARLGVEQNETISKSDILEYLAFSTFKLGNIDLALDLTNKLLEIIPTHPRALGNKVYYEREISNDKTKLVIESSEPEIRPYDEQAKKLYEGLCRGEISTPQEILIQLKCRYVDHGKPFLKIAPFKVEEAYTRPRILVFHDVMTDDEISTIKQMAHPRFRRATVTNSVTGQLETAHYRISKSAWLKEEEHKHVANIAQRVEDMTGLTMKTAEELQVVNYGIGGHYEPHYDFAKKEEENAFKSLGTGNRIATVLFYMSDVAQGGATVFPSIKAALWPKKGTAAFWYNLHHSGEGDASTRHAACPVLAGSKWVSNKWIHELGQEFRRPCELIRPPPELTA